MLTHSLLEEVTGLNTSNGGTELVSYRREEEFEMTEGSERVQLIAVAWMNDLHPSSGSNGILLP
jgi:hypothetical protein